jgi:hypothetical protein
MKALVGVCLVGLGFELRVLPLPLEPCPEGLVFDLGLFLTFLIYQ